MVGAPFQAVGSTTGEVNIQDVIDTTGLVGYDWVNYQRGDTMIIWDPTTQIYSKEYCWSSEDGGMGLENKWFDDGTFSAVSETVPVGGAFFINSSGAGGTIDFAAP